MAGNRNRLPPDAEEILNYFSGWDGDEFDPRFWPEPLPYRRFYLSSSNPEKYVIIDNSDFWWVSKNLWTEHHTGRGKVYACNGSGAKGRRPKLFIHREVCQRAFKPKSRDHNIADHKNGDERDNRKINLRWATPDENGKNKHGFYARQGRFYWQKEN